MHPTKHDEFSSITNWDRNGRGYPRRDGNRKSGSMYIQLYLYKNFVNPVVDGFVFALLCNRSLTSISSSEECYSSDSSPKKEIVGPVQPYADE